MGLAPDHPPGDEILRKAAVTADYSRAYPDPIAVSCGEALAIGEEDSEYPGWIWCTNCAGKSGWVPLACVDRSAARAIYDYSAAELTVREGDTVTLHKSENGWAWCANQAGESGWVPLAHLEDVE